MLVALGAFVGAATATGPNRSVLLATGHISTFRWTVSASRAAGSNGSRRPCIQVDVESLKRSSPSDPLEVGLGGGSLCGPVPNTQAEVDELAKPTVSVLAMAFSPSVSEVRLFFKGRRNRTLPLELLSSRKAKGLTSSRSASSLAHMQVTFALGLLPILPREGSRSWRTRALSAPVTTAGVRALL